MSDRDRFFLFRTDEIDSYLNQRPFGSAFVEYRPNARSSLTLSGENLTDSGAYILREFYFPNRTNPAPGIREERFRHSHARVALSYKLSFGGGGVAK